LTSNFSCVISFKLGIRGREPKRIKKKVKIYAFVGHSKSGKTGLIRQLLPELKKRGHAVAVIKHCGHGMDFDLESKDSWQFIDSGAEGVAMISSDQLAIVQRKREVDSTSVAAQYFRDVDIILVEGGRRESNLKKIEVLRRGGVEKVECRPEELIAVVSDRKVAVDKPVFHPDQIGKIADFLERGFEEKEDRVGLDIDGVSIPLNAFVQRIFENFVWGMATSLEGVKKNFRSLTLTVKRRDKKDEKY